MEDSTKKLKVVEDAPEEKKFVKEGIKLLKDKLKINTSRNEELKGGDDATEELVAGNTTQELRTNDKRTEN